MVNRNFSIYLLVFVVIVTLLLIVASFIKNKEKTLQTIIVGGEGKIIYLPIEGGHYSIEVNCSNFCIYHCNNNFSHCKCIKKYECRSLMLYPLNLPENFKVNNTHVEFIGIILRNINTVYARGVAIKLISIKPIKIMKEKQRTQKEVLTNETNVTLELENVSRVIESIEKQLGDIEKDLTNISLS